MKVRKRLCHFQKFEAIKFITKVLTFVEKERAVTISFKSYSSYLIKMSKMATFLTALSGVHWERNLAERVRPELLKYSSRFRTDWRETFLIQIILELKTKKEVSLAKMQI